MISNAQNAPMIIYFYENKNKQIFSWLGLSGTKIAAFVVVCYATILFIITQYDYSI